MRVVAELLEALQPAKPPVHAQRQVLKLAVPFGAVAGLERFVVQCSIRLYVKVLSESEKR